MKSRIGWAIAFLALAGAAISAVSLYNHYSGVPTEYCAFDETFNCDLVNRSVYSRFLGVPVALIGLLGYIAIGALAFIGRRGAKFLLFAATMIGLAFSLYLTYIEARVLMVWCILCVASLGVIVLLVALAAFHLRQPRLA